MSVLQCLRSVALSKRVFLPQSGQFLHGRPGRYNAVLWEGSRRCYSQSSEETLPSLPKSARVVISGGGVVGTSVAYHLAKAGWTDVVLLEQGQ